MDLKGDWETPHLFLLKAQKRYLDKDCPISACAQGVKEDGTSLALGNGEGVSFWRVRCRIGGGGGQEVSTTNPDLLIIKADIVELLL